jgi:hypothetical protein
VLNFFINIVAERVMLLPYLEAVQKSLTTISKILSELPGEHSLRPEERAAEIHELAVAPSVAATSNQLLTTQDPENLGAIHNGRPHTLTGPSLSIYHPIFQEFLQQYSSKVNIGEYTREDFVNASALNSYSAEYFESEADRHEKIKPLLERFLGTGAASRSKVYRGKKMEFEPDGHLMARLDCTAPQIIVRCAH